MTLHYIDPWLTVHLGDCREVMASMDPESVHCVVTSPPYWGLRDYGTASWEGGDEVCDHKPTIRPRADRPNVTGAGIGKADYPGQLPTFRDVCRKCGARRIDQQLGLEPTPEAYVDAMVAVFREVRRVLRSDGTVWLNLGDSYSGGKTDRDDNDINRRNIYDGSTAAQRESRKLKDNPKGRQRPVPLGLKPKDLVGIPWRVAFALQADGWYLRSDIIWAKPNPMPESVTDRPTKSHEYLFLLTKSARYWYDADAVREGVSGGTHGGGVKPSVRNVGGRTDGYTKPASNWRPELTCARYFGSDGAVCSTHPGRFEDGNANRCDAAPDPAGRNLRSVWTVATQPYPGAHFATFPPKLIEPCIKAGCPEGGTVLDPFAGSGTTAMVANRLSRRAVLIDLNADYLGQVMDRNRALPLGLETA